MLPKVYSWAYATGAGPTTLEGSFDNLWWVDTWSMLPLNRMDVLYPMIMPPFFRGT